jgi:VanZ family protein
MSRCWPAWTAYGFVAAVLVETIQGVLLPTRSASFGDVVANTAGMLLGAVLFLPIRPMLRHG